MSKRLGLPVLFLVWASTGASVWVSACANGDAPADVTPLGGPDSGSRDATDSGGTRDGLALEAGDAAVEVSEAGDVAFETIVASDAPTFDDAAPAGSCNKLVNDGSLVTLTRAPIAMPGAAGGTIVDGFYERTEWKEYTGEGGGSGPATDTDRTVAIFSGGKFDIVRSGNGAANEYTSGTYVTAADSITLTKSCPSGGTSVSPYTKFEATPSGFVIYSPTLKMSLRYRKR